VWQGRAAPDRGAASLTTGAPDGARGGLSALWLPVLVLVLLPVLAQVPAWLLGLDPDPDPLMTGLGTQLAGGPLTGLPWIDPCVGSINQTLGRLSASLWLHGVVPWWNPYSGVGMPLAAEMTPSSLFLPFVLTEHFGHGFVALKIEMQVLAGFATYALLRELRLSGAVALAGAAAFEMNGTFAWFSHAPYMPLPFLPLLVFGIERVRAGAEAGRFAGAGWVAVAIAGSLYAGFPETVYLDGLFGLVWALCRLPGLSGRARRAATVWTVLGGGVGLLLAAPAVWPFLDFLRHASVGKHASGGAEQGLPLAAFPMFVLPYVYGPLYAYGSADPLDRLDNAIWANIGGYAGLLVVVLAVVGLVYGRRLTALRWGLAGWIVVCLAKSGQVPGVAQALDLIPGVGQIYVFRYAEPSWSFAAIVLAAFALERCREAVVLPRRAALVAAGAALVLLALSVLASHALRAAIHAGGAQPRQFFLASVLFAAVLAAAAVALLSWCGRVASGVLGAAMVAEAWLLFVVPTFQGYRHGPLDLAPVRFLQSHLGLQRYYSLGPLPPNYGAAYQVRGVSHMYLPVDSDWVSYVHANLDRYVEPIHFHAIPRGPDVPSPEDELRTHLAEYERVGVRYVLTRTGQPLTRRFGVTDGLQAGETPLQLADGQDLVGTFAEATPQAGRIADLSITLATYAATPDGRLQLQVCGAAGCASGAADLSQAVDFGAFAVPLDTSLAVSAGEFLRYTLRRAGGTRPVAVWLRAAAADAPAPVGPQGPIAGRAPHLAAEYAAEPGAPWRVFRDGNVEIFELPNPAPYFEVADGPCDLQVADAEHVTARCAAPATLTRREMFDAGWRVEVNGDAVPVERIDAVFQQVRLPVGAAEVRFAYRPPFTRAACAAAAAGLLALAAMAARSRRVS
jgi:hypothetical protein